MRPARERGLLVAATVAVTVAADQLSKEWALRELDDGHTIGLVPTLEFDLTRNSGFSFSTGSGNGQIVGALVICICMLLMWMLWRERSTPRAAILATILGGAVGNLIDRVARSTDGFLSGEVIDFIDVSWYAVFNLADTFVVCGCVALVIYELKHRSSETAPLPADDDFTDRLAD